MIFLYEQVSPPRASGIFRCGQAVLRAKYLTSCILDPFSPDAVDPCRHGLLGLATDGAMHVCLPEEGCELW